MFTSPTCKSIRLFPLFSMLSILLFLFFQKKKKKETGRDSVLTSSSGPQTQHHLANILADHYKTEDTGFSLQLGEP